MARVLTDPSSPTLEVAKNHIEANCHSVAPHHRVNEALSSLLRITTDAAPKVELHRNKGTPRKEEDIGIWQDRFNAANSIDIALHQYVIDNFDRWIDTITDRWQSISSVKDKKL